MKKNFFLKLASGLLVLCLASTCAIGTTFAKYTTAGTSTDTARVAKWGVTITTAGNTFGGAYKSADGTVSTTYDATADSVHSAGGNVVAPGTNGTMASFVVTGTPEVDVTVSYNANLTLAGWTIDDSTEYCPLVFTVGTDTYGTSDTTAKNKYDSVSQLVAGVEAAIEAYTATYEANTDLSTINDDISVSWAWAFETGADDTAKANNNVKDTKLGNLEVAPTVTLTVDVTITQVD